MDAFYVTRLMETILEFGIELNWYLENELSKALGETNLECIL